MSSHGPLSRATGLIDNLTDRDWIEAEEHFTTDQDAVKFDKYAPEEKAKPKAMRNIENKRVNCSFVKADDGTIYAIKNGDCIGEGMFGKVKIIQARNGENFAVKIQDEKNKELSELQVLNALGQLHGIAKRTYKGKKKFKEQPMTEKSYMFMELQKGKALSKELYVGVDTDPLSPDAKRSPLTEKQKLIFAIQCAKEVQYLHENRIIHADIKPPNFMANVNGNVISIAAIDFGFSKKLPADQETLEDRWCGSPLYCAPEIIELNYDENGKATTIKARKDPATFSFASDIYALGVMYKEDFKLDMGKAFYDKINAKDPKDRHSMDDLINSLESRLEANQQYDNTVEALKGYAKDFEKQYQNKRQESGWGFFKSRFAGREIRKGQLSTLKSDLESFINNPTIGTLANLNQTLDSISAEIKGEVHFAGASGLAAIVLDIQNKIMDNPPKLKAEKGPTPF